MLTNKIISHYRVMERIGQGGLGEVFAAEDTILSRRVALKFLLGEKNALEREQILDEARAAASLDHPYVCKVFETGEYEGKPFIVMEYLEGETLAQRLALGPMTFSEALTFATEISEALAEAHSKGIIHCDLKPSNVMITRSGHVKLMDFGLARRTRPEEQPAADLTRTMVGRVGGTLAYMAPEQARGESLDARTDVFALGILFFEMLAGVHPFQKNSRETTIAAILYEEAPDIGEYVLAAPSSLAHVLACTLAKDASERYATAGELVSELVALRDSGIIPSSSATLPGIAILPFKDISPQHDQEYFCDGLAEELIVAMGRIEQLRVAARSAAFRYRNAEIGLREIGRALNVTAILEGSVRKAGNRLRIVVNLVNTENGFPIWSERYDRQLDDIFEIQDGLSRAIADKLRLTFTLPESGRLIQTGSQNVRAYELYLKARHFWNKRTEENLRLSIEQFEQALAEDPDYAMAYAGLADAWVTLSLYGAVRPIDAMPRARSAAHRALELQPKLAEALTSRACIRAVFDWDWSAAARDFEAAISLNPRYAQARQWFAMNCLAPRGQFARARAEVKAASELEPVSLPIATSLGALDFIEGNYEAAIRQLRTVLELDERFYLAHYFMGQAYSEMQMHGDAIRELERAAALTRRSSESLAALGYALAAAGKREESLLALDELSERSTMRYVSPVLIAQVEMGLQRHDEAIHRLEEAFLVRATDLIWLGVRPAFEPVRSHERVANILAEAGLKIHPRGSVPSTE